ncbi:crotonase/enoyl-CoA hydratase family protein [Actinomadura sp. LD22]|uniref:Crotonase/enoyl-CoA hydratase family protein n=1 Tax=Actinomadura physcomitrii TaxID=2650748 RepID=A0A6I4MFZ6_9ACTN|nr:enoyl-CoA hydratase-related protein [Actinomadura physcomitrii]MWA02917.1 crotonase/enoyl-CoA hydratase family protein [Actinomadura physcomitrii]
MSDGLPVIHEVAEGVAEVTLNRPEKMNALTPEMICRLADAWDAVQADPLVRVAILTSAGDRAFSAGADLGRLTTLLTRSREPEDEWDERLRAEPKLLNRAMLRRTDMTTPVIAAARGAVVGGGMELLLACDLRVVSEKSVLGLTEVKRGLIPAAGGVARVARQVSAAHAAEILLIGDKIDAAAAYRMGLVNRVVPADQVLKAARELAAAMAENGPLAMRAAKDAMVGSSGASLSEAFGIEDELIKGLLRSKDAREGSKAFMEKRRPEFTGT